jgi:ABC-type lipopolysaccharide export system ATPase subunit
LERTNSGSGMRMAGIQLKNVYKTYPGNVTAVSDFSLEIADTEFVVLVGPVGLRQIDSPAYNRGARGGDKGRRVYRRPARQRCAG